MSDVRSAKTTRIERLGALLSVLVAGCPTQTSQGPLHWVDKPVDPPAPAVVSPPSPPLRTLALPPEVRCPRVNAGLPDQPPPDLSLLEKILEHTWCRSTVDGTRMLAFSADGRLKMVEGFETPQPHGTYALCWGLVGDEIAILGLPGAWDVWHVDHYPGYPTLAFRNESHVPCRPPPLSGPKN